MDQNSPAQGVAESSRKSDQKREPTDQTITRLLSGISSENAEQLVKHIDLLEMVIEAFPGGICVFDKYQEMLLCNKNVRLIFDYPDELFTPGLPTIEQLLHFNAERGEYGPGSPDHHVSHYMGMIKKGEPHAYETIRGDGTVIETNAVPMENGGFILIHTDVTERSNRARKLEILLDNFPGGICVFDRHNKMILHNDKLREMLEYPDQLFEDGPPDLETIFRFNAERGEYGSGSADKKVAERLRLVSQREAHVYDRTRPNGTVMEIRGTPVESGGFVTTYIDVTEQRARTEQLEALLENFPGAIAVYDKDLQMTIHNQMLKEMLEYPDHLFENGLPNLEDIFLFNARRGEYGAGKAEDQVYDRMQLVRARKPHQYERLRPNGIFLEIRGVPLEGGGFVTTYLDVTERRRNQALMAHMAHHDALTKLPNRVLFRERLEHALAQAKRGNHIGLLYLDLDGFKPVNDTYGHSIGDELLKSVAGRINNVKRETDTLARLGGDEFVIIQIGDVEKPDAERFATRIVNALNEPFKIGTAVLNISTSIGIALTLEHGFDPDILLRKADNALYEAKANGKAGYSFYQETEQAEE